jgi:hypothetical protein
MNFDNSVTSVLHRFPENHPGSPTLGPDGHTLYFFSAEGRLLTVSTADGSGAVLARVDAEISPQAPLLVPDGSIIGTTFDGGKKLAGQVFRISGF